MARGIPEFLEALLVRLPTKASREEIDAGFSSQEPAVKLAAAVAAVGWDAPRGAALVVELCRAAMEAPLDARDDLVRELPMLRLLDVILALHAAGALDAAAEAQAAVRGCLHDSGLELALAQGPLGGVWTLTEEIGGLPREFPRPLRTAFAHATRTGDLTSAYIDTCRAIELDRSDVSLWASKLAASAPNVSGIMQTALSNTRAEARNAPASSSRGLVAADPDVSRVRTAVHVSVDSPASHRAELTSATPPTPDAAIVRPFCPGPRRVRRRPAGGGRRRPVRPRRLGSRAARLRRHPGLRRGAARGQCGALPAAHRIKRALRRTPGASATAFLQPGGDRALAGLRHRQDEAETESGTRDRRDRSRHHLFPGRNHARRRAGRAPERGSGTGSRPAP